MHVHCAVAGTHAHLCGHGEKTRAFDTVAKHLRQHYVDALEKDSVVATDDDWDRLNTVSGKACQVQWKKLFDNGLNPQWRCSDNDLFESADDLLSNMTATRSRALVSGLSSRCWCTMITRCCGYKSLPGHYLTAR
jgi:hypothetical protein